MCSGDWKLTTNIVRTVPSVATTAPPTGKLFYKAICVTMVKIRANRVNLTDMTEKFMDMLGTPGDNNNKIIQIANTFVAGLQKAGCWDVVHTRAFTARQLLGSLQETKGKDGGLYMWVHSNFVGNPARNPGLVIGSTENFAKREGEHRNAAKRAKETAPQYKAWRESSNHHCYRLAAMSNAKTERDTMYWAELLAILMFDTQHTAVKSRVLDTRFLDAGAEDADDDETHQTMATDDVGGQSSKTTMLNVDKKVIATKLANLMKDVRDETGWEGGCIRSSFGAHGLNWSTPCAEGEDRTAIPWYKITIPGKVDIFRRTKPFSLLSDKKNKTSYDLLLKQSKGESSKTFLRVFIPKDLPGLTLDTPVWASVEIMHNSRHEIPLANLPDVEQYQYAHMINRLGVCIEYVDASGIFHRI